MRRLGKSAKETLQKPLEFSLAAKPFPKGHGDFLEHLIFLCYAFVRSCSKKNSFAYTKERELFMQEQDLRKMYPILTRYF